METVAYLGALVFGKYCFNNVLRYNEASSCFYILNPPPAPSRYVIIYILPSYVLSSSYRKLHCIFWTRYFVFSPSSLLEYGFKSVLVMLFLAGGNISRNTGPCVIVWLIEKSIVINLTDGRIVAQYIDQLFYKQLPRVMSFISICKGDWLNYGSTSPPPWARRDLCAGTADHERLLEEWQGDPRHDRPGGLATYG